MSNENRIDAEVRLDHKSVDVGVSQVATQMGRLDKAVENSSGTLDRNLTRALTALGGQVRALNFNTLTGQLNNLAGSDFFGKIGDGGKSALTDIIKLGTGFRAEVSQIQTLAPNLNGDALEKYAEQLRTIGRELGVGVGPTEAAAGAYAVLQNGFEDAADAQLVLSNALKTGIAGRSKEAGAAIDLVTGTLNAFNLKAAESEALGDKIFVAIQKGGADLTVDTLARSLGRVSGLANSAGVSIDEMFAVLATATSKGQQTGQVMDGLAGIINAIQKPTDDAKKEFQALGIQVDAAALKQKGLLSVLREIDVALKSRGTAGSLTRIGGEQSSRALLSNLTGDNFSKFEDNTQASINSAGRQKQVLETVGKTAESAYSRMQAAGERFKVGLEKDIEPALIALANAGQKAFDFFDAIPGPMKTAGVVMLAVAVAAGTFGTAALFVANGLFALNANLAASGIALPLFSRGASVASKDLALFKAHTAAMNGVQTGFMVTLKASATLANAYALTLSGIGLAAVGATLYLSNMVAEAEAADQALALAEKGHSNLFGSRVDKIKEVGQVDKQTALGTTVDILAASDVDGADIRFQAAQERNKLDKLSGDARKKALDEIEQLEKKASELDKFIAGRTNAASPEVKEARQKGDDERFKDELQLIRISKDGHDQKIARLSILRQQFEQDGDKRRQITDQIHHHEEQRDRETEARKKKSAQDLLNNRLQNVDNSTDSDEKKLIQLRKLAKIYQDNGEARRAIEDRIFKIEEATNKKREDSVKKLADLKEQAAQADEQRSQDRQAELQRLGGRGVDTFDAQVDELANQGRSRAKEIESSLAADIAKEDDPEVVKQRKALAAQQQVDNQANFDRQGAELLRADKQQRLGNEQGLLQGEQRTADLRIQILQKQLAAGTDVQSQLKQAVLERLALQEREIQVQAELAKAQTEDPRLAAQAEQQAQGQILDARRRATEEIHNGTKALQDQKKAKDALNGKSEFSGNILSLDQFIEGEKNRFFGPDSRGSVTPPDIPGINVREAEQQIRNARIRRPGELGSAGAPQVTVVPLSGRIDVVLQDQQGKRIPSEVKKVEIGGRDSETAKSRGTTRGGL